MCNFIFLHISPVLDPPLLRIKFDLHLSLAVTCNQAFNSANSPFCATWPFLHLEPLSLAVLHLRRVTSLTPFLFPFGGKHVLNGGTGNKIWSHCMGKCRNFAEINTLPTIYSPSNILNLASHGVIFPFLFTC